MSDRVDINMLKREIENNLKSDNQIIKKIIKELYKKPEIGGEEFFAKELITKILRDHDFEINENITNLPTAFIATSNYNNTEPNIAFLTEYDALPEIGHACGHNASAAASIGAALALSECIKKWKINGTVYVIGTPGEENIGSKAILIKNGYFNNIDIAMMVHSYNYWLLDPKLFALNALEITFKGKAAHAANSPELGVNALDALILIFNGISCLRQQTKDRTRIHGIITKGGDIPGSIPELTSAKIYVRADESKYLENLTERVKKCAYAASIATGCKVSIKSFEEHTDGLVSNKILLNLFENNLSKFVKKDSITISEEQMFGSSDVGNVSYCVPTIQPANAIASQGINVHTPEFTRETIKEKALNNVIYSGYAMASTGLEIMVDENLLKLIKEEFKEATKDIKNNSNSNKSKKK